MPSILIYTDPVKLGLCEMPIYTVGDDQNWSLQFSNGQNLFNPVGVSLRLGHMNGLNDLTYANAFEWIDRLNNRHVGSFAIAAGVPGSLTWDEDPIQVQGADGCWLIRGRTPPCSQIRKVGVIYGGAGLSAAPRVDFNGGVTGATGKGATATATLGGGSTVTAITVTNPGANYSTPPYVFLSGGGGSGAMATAGLTSGQVTAITVRNAGSGYSTAPTVTIIDPEASATASVGGTSVIQSLILSNGGSGYTSAPTVAITGGGGSSGAATAALLKSTWGVGSVAVTNGGSDYTSAPEVGFSGGTGSGVTAIAELIPRGVGSKVTITNPGYYSGGSISFSMTASGGDGSGCVVRPFMLQSDDGHWYLDSVEVTNSGVGYTVAPTLTLIVSGVTTVVAAAATLVISPGAIGRVIITNPGSGYGATAPTVAFTGGGGMSAAATAVVAGSPVGSLTLTNAGSGYTSVPAVGFSGGNGSGASALAAMSFGITDITLLQPGFAYTSLPSVTLYPGHGSILEPQGIETNPTPYVRNHNPASAVAGIVAIPFSHGRTDSSNNLIYDDSLLIIKPRTLLTPTLTLQGDGLTWAGVFNPVTAFVTAVLNYRRSCVVDVEIFGGGRVLYQGKLAIVNKMS